MSEEQSMFAEMLGIKRHPQPKPVQVVRSVSKHLVDPVNMVDELDVQREVVEAMALEKAELEEARSALEREKLELMQEKRDQRVTEQKKDGDAENRKRECRDQLEAEGLSDTLFIF